MMAPATMTVLVVTALATWQAFQRPDLMQRWMFNPHAILADRQVERMVTSGFIHKDWMHFAMNAYSFLCFGQIIEMIYGVNTLLLVYFSSIIGGSCLSLFIHRHHDYRALGASGGVCGVIFASIFLMPGGWMRPIFFPIEIPAYAYAIIFLVGSFYRHRRGTDNIGHDAHLGGAMVGLLVAAVLYPDLIRAQPIMFATVLGISILILFTLIFDPLHLTKLRISRSIEVPVGGERERRYAENRARNQTMSEIDTLLDKVARKGMESLSASERQRLDQLSRKLKGENV